MNMKSYNNYGVILLLLLVSFSSCENFLDRQPLEELSKDKFWKTKADAELWTIGLYDALQGALGDNYFMWGEVRSDNQQQAGTGTDQALFLTNTLTADMGVCNWANLYSAISSANFGIKYLSAISDLTETELKLYLGQAYTARALMYFYAIRVWGGVPLLLEPYEGAEGQVEYNVRTSVDEVKKQIFKDLNSALSCFDLGTPSVTRFNRGAALAIQTDVHMWFKEYKEAIDASDKLIALKKYSFAANSDEWHQIFESPVNSSEPIFFLDWDAQTDRKNGVCKYLASEGPSPNYKIREALWDSLIIRKKDDRLLYMTDTVRMFYKNSMIPISEETYDIYTQIFYCNKFSRYDASQDNSDISPLMPSGRYVSPTEITYMPMIPLYRFSDIMLLRAEAFNKLGDGDAARSIVNDIRRRIGYLRTEEIPDPSFIPDPDNPEQEIPTIVVTIGEVTSENAPDGTVLENVILQERQFELWGEGKRWFDLVRTDKVAEVMDPILKERGVEEGFNDMRRILFPLHSSVFEANPLLEQNEPYTKY